MISIDIEKDGVPAADKGPQRRLSKNAQSIGRSIGQVGRRIYKTISRKSTLEHTPADTAHVEIPQAASPEPEDLAPLHKLSNDLLELIILTAVGLIPDKTKHAARAYELEYTCRRWRNLIKSCGRFWVIIFSADKPKKIAHCLRASGDALLELHSTLGYYPSPPAEANQSPTALMLTPPKKPEVENREGNEQKGTEQPLKPADYDVSAASDRWGILDLYFEPADNILELLKKPAPNVTELTIRRKHPRAEASPAQQTGGSDQIFSGEAPKLQDVDVDGIPFKWVSEIFKSLKTLSIQNEAYYPSGLEMKDIHALLEANPKLTLFKLVQPPSAPIPGSFPEGEEGNLVLKDVTYLELSAHHQSLA